MQYSITTPQQFIYTLANTEDHEWGEVVHTIESTDPHILTTEVVENFVTACLNNDEWPRNRLINLPPQSFNHRTKKALLTRDPDTIFYIPEEALGETEVLYAIDMAQRQSGFTSPPSDHLEEIPDALPSHALTPRVWNALHTKLGVPVDKAQMARIQQLAGIKT
jgi:hypothetical protein